MTEISLASLREKPFELLRAMEQRALASGVATGESPAGREWVGIGFRLGDEHFLAPREEVREIIACPASMARVPGARPWIAGLVSLRGQLLTLVDLQGFLGGAAIRLGRDSRVLVLNHRELSAGLLVDEVLGFRRFSEAARVDAGAASRLRCGRFLAGAFPQGEARWPVFSFATLAETPTFLRAAEEG
jgi:twitching motility protein PilI